MRKLLFHIPIITLFTLSYCQKGIQLQTSTINVKTMVCERCAETIKKAVFNLEGVKDIDVNFKDKTIRVTYVPIQTNLESIEIAITRAGYDANDRKRDPAAYEELEECCKNHN